MKRAIAGFLLLVGIGVAPAFAFVGDRGMRNDLRQDLRHDQARIAQGRYEFRRDYHRDEYAAARRERFDQRRDHRDMHRERRDLSWDRR